MMLLIASFQIGQGLQAANFYWDSDADATGNVVDGTNLGGTGTWDLGTANWWDTVGMVIWPNSTADTAIFAGTAGIVTLATPLSVGSLQFDSSGYQLTGSTLTLGGAATISVSAGNHAGVLSDISGTSGLTKTGAGTLNLGPLNSYTGNTTIQGGVVEVYQDESLGTGGGDIILDGGTLSALGNNFYSTRDITVNAGGGTLAVSRENSNFGSMRLAGMISGVGTLTKTGFGQLRLDGDSSGFTGAFILDQGTVRLNPYTDRGLVSNVPALGASSFEIHAGGDLLLYYNSLGTTPYYSAVSETAPVHMTGGRIQYISNNSGAVSPWTQTMGDLFLDGGANRFLVQRTSSSSATLLAFGDLTHAAGATADFRGTDGSGVTLATLGSPGNQPRLTFNSLPAPVNDGILGGWATVNLNDFADYDPVLGVRLATYTSTDITTAAAADNVAITGAGGVIATIGDTTVNSIKWTATASTSTIQQDPGSTLTIDTGGLLVLGNFNKRIQASSGDATIKANGGALYIYNNQGTLTIDSIIADGDQPTALVKSQAASLTLNGANTYTGGTYLNGGNNLNTGSTAGVTYLGTGPVFITGGILVQNRPGATTSTQGYTVSGGGAIFVNTSTLPFTTDGDRYTIDGNSVIAGPSTTGSGLNSLTYVAGAVSAGGEVHLEPGATVMHTTNNAAMGIGTNTIQGLPNNMDFYFGEGATQTAGSGVTVGIGTPWKGLGTDRNTRGWDQGTITVNGSDFELHGLLAPSVHGESQSAYAMRLGNNTAGLPVAGAPTITGAAATPLNAHVTGGIVQLMDDAAVYGDTTAGSPLTFLVEPGATLEVTADGAMGSGNGIASAQVLDGGTFQQFYSTSTATNIAISAASASGINGNVTVQPRGRFLAQHNAGLSGAGIITFEPRSILQLNNNTGWTGAQAEAAVGINLAVIKIQVDNFGEAGKPLLTNYGIDGTGIYEWGANANAANPSAPNTPILSLNGGIVINDAFDRSFDLTANGFIEILAGGGTLASTTGQLFNIQERVELHGNTLTIGYADVIDGDPGLGDLRLRNVTSDVAGGMINVISGAQARINLTDAIQDDITITLQAGAWLDVDNNDTILELIGNGATSRVMGDATLTVTRAGDYDFNASLGDTAKVTQAGGGILTIIQDADGVGTLTASSGTIKIGTGVSIGTGYTLNPVTGGIIDVNGLTVGAASLLGDATGTVNLGGGVLEFTNAGTVTIDSSEAVINGPGTVRTVGTGSVRFNLDPTRLTNIDTIDIWNGEFRIDGTAGVADSFLIDVTTINLGDNFATTGGTGFRAFPRLFLVNAETTQTAALNVNGGWLVSDLGTYIDPAVGGGTDAQNIWSAPITFTGVATNNLFDVNDPGTPPTTPEVHFVSGVISGTGGFSKINTGSLNLIANNTIEGDIYVQRAGPGGAGLTSKGGLTLSGAAGALSAANSVVVSRDGSFYLDNTVDVNPDRVGDTTGLTLRSQGRIRLAGNSALPVSETMGAIYIDNGSGKINFDLDDTTPQLATLTFASFKRDPGSIAQFQVLDNTPGAFGSALGGNAILNIADSGALSTLYGGGGANGSSNKRIVLGAFGGVNNISNHFMTFDSVNTTELRPLVWDGTETGSEYFLSREAASAPAPDTLIAPHQFTRAGLVTHDQNVLINFNVDVAKDGQVGTGLPGSGSDYGWYGAAPIAILENVAMNSLRFGTDTPTNGTNSNEFGSALVLAPGARLYLGDKAADAEIGAISTSGSGMILFGRDISGGPPGSNQFIAGGYLDFGTREAILVNESGNSAFFRSNITGSGGLTKAGAQTIYLDNSNSYTGVTNIAEGILDIRDQNALGGSSLVKIEGSGQLYLELGTNVLNSTISATPPNLYVGVNDASRTILHSNSANNTWGGDVIIDNVDNSGNWVFTSYFGTGALYTLNIDGNIYSNEEGGPGGIPANHISTDTTLNDARLIMTAGVNAAGGVINLNGQFRDNQFGAIATPVTSDNENQLLRFFVRGSDQAVVNARQQWDSAGLIFVENGILRYEGDGNFWSPQAAANMNAANGQSGMRIGGNSNNWNAAVMLTKPGQVLNIGRIDIGGDGTTDYNQFGNNMLAGTNNSGTVTFGDGTDRVVFNGANAANNFVRDLTAYQAGGGTMELNFRLDDTDGDSHTSFTKIGRGVVNFNGQNDVNGAAQDGDVEQLNMSGGLLRLTNYGNATGRRFDAGAMITLAGGGIEMDGASSIQNETANYTGVAVGVLSNFPTAQTLIAPGGSDVIVTSKAGRTTTMNIGSLTLATNRQSGGTVNFVENGNGGTSNITLLGSGGGSIQADDTPYAWATYGDSYTYNAAAATYSLNALDFAMTTGGSGDLAAFAGATRQNEDDVTLWTAGNDVSEGLAGFNGGAAASPVNTLHFDFDGAGSLDASNGLVVTSGGIMVSSAVLTGTKSIINGTLSAGGTADLIIHQYGGAPMTITSVIADDGGNALVKTGSGTLILTGLNTYTGKTFLNGGTLQISTDANLGTAPVAPVVDAIYVNGGNLHTTADFTLDANRGITLGGNGGEFQVDASTTLTYGGVIASEANVIANYSANPAVGRIEKTGAGTLLLTGINNSYNGRTEIREGTLKWEPTFTGSTTANPFGSNSAFLDGTIVRSGATLELAPKTPLNNSSFNAILQEWFTFEGGSILDISPVNSVADPHDINYYFRGVLELDSLGHAGTPDGFQTPDSLLGAVIFDVGGQGSTNLNDAGGYLTGDGGITKIGAGQLTFRENNPEWTGQLIINQGSAVISSAGNPLGVGTLPIIIGHSLFAEQAGEPDSGNGTVSLLFQDEGGYRDVSVISQDIIVRADDGAGAQTKRIGAWFLANIDEVNYAGNITLRDDVQLYYRDDTRDSAITNSSTQVSNSTRSIGTLGNQETVFINFNGNLIGAVGNDITTVVDQSGNANVINGSITGANDDLVVRAIFALNGDNSGWAGNLTIGNTTADVDTNHIVTLGNPLAISANNNLTMRSNATIRVSGNDIVVGNLSGSGTTDNFIENSSSVSPGSITITQTTDAIVDAVIRDGETVFILQPGESYQSLSLVKAGPAVLELTKGNTFTGSTTLAGGTLRLSYDADNSMLSDTAALIMNDGILDLAGTVAHSEIVGSTIINGSVAIERSAGTSVINLNTITRNAGSLRISLDNIATTDNTNVNGILGGWATVGGSFATNSTNGADGLIVGLATFDQNIDRLTGGAGTQSIDDGAAGNVRIVEDGSTASPITMTGVGTTTINTLLQAATGGEAIVEIGGGNTLRIATGGILQPNGAGALTFGQTGTLTGGAADNTAATMFIQNQDETGLVRLTVGAPIYNNGTGMVDVRTTGPGQTVFLGDNAYTGDTLVGSGQLSVGNGGTSGALGTGNVKVEPSATIEFNRSDALLHVVGELRGGGTVIQAGTGTTTLDTASTGNTLTFIMADGSLVSGTDNAINTTGTAYFGASVGSTTVGSLDLTNGSTILGGLVVRTNSTAANQLIIGAGKTLTINGTVTIGADLNNSDVALTATGGGDLVVNSSGGNFQIGGASGNNEGRAVVNLSGLTNFTANLGAGIFRLGDDNTGTGDNTSSLTLATNNTITAGSIEIGDGAGGAFQHTLNLGAGTNVLNADIVNIGSAVNRRRSGGLVFFAGPTGTVDIRASDGVGRALINVVNTTTSDTATIVSVVSLNDHTANILGGAVTMAARSANTGGAVAILEFNQGTLDFLTLNMASRTGVGTGDATATLTLGDSGMVPTSATIGALNMAENTSAGGVVTATIDISGGNVSIGTGSGDAINMANAGTGNTVTSSINMTGGTTTLTGNVIRTGGLGTENATLTLDGGVLNMSGNSIGTALAPVSFVAASGTLSNLGGLNGGTVVLDKTTAGTLILEGVNTYTGGTTVSTGGTLLANSTVGSATGSGVVAVLPGATLGGTGVVVPAPDTNIVINGTFAPGTPGGIIGEDMALAVSGTGSISFDGAATFDIFTNTGGANPASSNDLAIISADDWANVIFGGSSTLNVVTTLDSTTWAQGDSWRLFDWDGIGGGSPGGFAALNLPALGANLFWDIGGLYTTGTIAVVVPEPSRALFLLFGLAGLLLRRRRQQGSLVP